MNTLPHAAQPSFEQVYPKAPFAELIRLSLVLAERIAKLRARLMEAEPVRVGPRQNA